MKITITYTCNNYEKGEDIGKQAVAEHISKL